LRECGGEVDLSALAQSIRAADRVVLPGVGAFSDAMDGMNKTGLASALVEFARTGRPLLGICLGMQMLMTASEEFGTRPGLGLISGPVVQIPRRVGLKVPHTGWSEIYPSTPGAWNSTILAEAAPGTPVYFVHSYSAIPDNESDRLADVNYGGFRVSAAVRRDNVTGCQFHPEKSGTVGLAILRSFLNS